MVIVTPTCWRYLLPERRCLHETFSEDTSCWYVNIFFDVISTQAINLSYFAADTTIKLSSPCHGWQIVGNMLDEWVLLGRRIHRFFYSCTIFEWIPTWYHVICFIRDFMFLGPPHNDNSSYVMLFRRNMVRLSCKRYFYHILSLMAAKLRMIRLTEISSSLKESREHEC